MAAIDISRFVSIKSDFPETSSIAGRNFGGLVFTPSSMINDAGAGGVTKAQFDEGAVVRLRLDQVSTAFGSTKTEGGVTTYVPEYEFAVGYYGYVSPSNTFVAPLSFAKIKEGETPLQAFERVQQETNMFGSFTFLSEEVTDDQLKDVASDNSSLDTKFLFVVNKKEQDSDTPAAVQTMAKAYGNYSGAVFVYGKTAWSAYMPMAILAATDFDDGVVSVHMFKQFSGELPVKVTDDDWEDYKKAYVNFCGRTQTNGSTIDFYQCGFNTDGTDSGVYCNEMWFKSACCTSLLNLQLSVERVPADAYGVSLVRGRILDIANDAVKNGMFMAKTVTKEQIEKIRDIVLRLGGTGDVVSEAVSGIETNGNYVWAFVDTDEATEEYVIRWFVFYGSADSVRSFKGVDFIVK